MKFYTNCGDVGPRAILAFGEMADDELIVLCENNPASSYLGGGAWRELQTRGWTSGEEDCGESFTRNAFDR